MVKVKNKYTYSIFTIVLVYFLSVTYYFLIFRYLKITPLGKSWRENNPGIFWNQVESSWTHNQNTKPRKFGSFRVFMVDSPSVPFTSSRSTNKAPLRRNRRNLRNRTNRGQRVIQFEIKTSYKFKKLSCRLLIFGKSQHNFLTAEEQTAVKETRRLKKVEISEHKVKSK